MAALRHAFLAIGIAIVAASVVSMHQLSSDHTLATSERSSSHAHGASLTTTDREHLASTSDDHFADSLDWLPVNWPAAYGVAVNGETVSVSGTTLTGASAGVAAAEWVAMTPMGDDDGCAACASHLMLMATCLLALTLVVGSWLLRSPPVRLTAGVKVRPVLVVGKGRARIRPSLSLAELSLRRV